MMTHPIHSVTEKKLPSEKKLYIEIMRVVAAYFVIFNHSDGYFLFPQYLSDPPRFWCYLFVSIFTKFAVPLFFAISGALLLDRPQETIKKLWFGRIFKYVFILLLGSMYAYLSDIGAFRDPTVLKNHERFWQVFVTQVYSIDLRTHFWYLYSYIAFLMVLPFLRALVQNLENKFFWYLIGLAIICKAILPMTEYVIWKGDYTLNPSFTLGWIVENIVLFPCVGYFLEHRSFMHRSGKTVLFLWMANILSILIACWMTRFRGNILGGYNPLESEYFHTSFDLLGCVTIFVTIRYLTNNIPIGYRIKRLILSCASCSFGIYFFHILLPVGWMGQTIQSAISGKMLGAFFISGYRMILCWVLTSLLKKVPVVRKFL